MKKYFKILAIVFAVFSYTGIKTTEAKSSIKDSRVINAYKRNKEFKEVKTLYHLIYNMQYNYSKFNSNNTVFKPLIKINNKSARLDKTKVIIKENISSLEYISGSKAIVKYGSDASNGVYLITTK